jgi:hypothetical protein
MRTPVLSPRFRTLLAAAALIAAAAPARALEEGEFDPAPWDRLLERYVSEAGVDYAAWKADGTAELDAFLAACGDYDLKSAFGKEPRGGFLVNAYNARVVRQVLEHYPVESVRDIEGFFDGNPVRIAGSHRTLNAIEEMVASVFKHRPDVLLALCPGAAGGPALALDAYEAANLEPQAYGIAAAYLQKDRRHRFDRETGTLHLTPFFETHAAILEGQEKGLAGFLQRFLPLADIVALVGAEAEGEYRTVYAPIDWSLNDAAGQETGNAVEGGR